MVILCSHNKICGQINSCGGVGLNAVMGHQHIESE